MFDYQEIKEGTYIEIVCKSKNTCIGTVSKVGCIKKGNNINFYIDIFCEDSFSIEKIWDRDINSITIS